jgi:hypothetical protein
MILRLDRSDGLLKLFTHIRIPHKSSVTPDADIYTSFNALAQIVLQHMVLAFAGKDAGKAEC